MNEKNYSVKDKQIKIYEIIQERRNEEVITIKKFIHPKDKFLKAYIRQLSAFERFSGNAIHDGSELEVVINKRDISIDMYIEFKSKNYQITAIDQLEFYNNEIKIRMKEVNYQTFDIEEETSWQLQ